MMNLKSQEIIDMVWNGMLAIAAVAVFAMLPLEAIAQTPTTPAPGVGTGSALDRLFCNILSVVTGTVGKGIATIALVIIGVGALMGKVSWGMAIIVALGIAIVFGASSIVTSISGQGAAESQGNSGAACSVNVIDTQYNSGGTAGNN